MSIGSSAIRLDVREVGLLWLRCASYLENKEQHAD